MGRDIITISHLTKYYGNTKALDNISCSLPGGIIGLLGPNGAGKTTLIKVLLGLVSFQSGNGSVLGFDIKNDSKSIRQKVGYQPEDDCVIIGLSGVEMVGYLAQLCGFEKLEGLRRAHEILDYLGIAQERYREVQTYSTGMKQKIKIAQALVHDPEILILDEPTSGLDPQVREKILDIIYDLGIKAQKSIILSTHILADVRKICDYVVIMSRGRILVADKLDNLEKPIDNSFFVRFQPLSDSLVACLKNKGYVVERCAFDVLNIKSADEEICNVLLKIAKEQNVQVRQIIPAQSNLEEFFVKAVNKEGGKK